MNEPEAKQIKHFLESGKVGMAEDEEANDLYGPHSLKGQQTPESILLRLKDSENAESGRPLVRRRLTFEDEDFSHGFSGRHNSGYNRVTSRHRTIGRDIRYNVL